MIHSHTQDPAIVKINQDIGRNIYRERMLMGLSQFDISEALRVRAQQVQKYESGKNGISAARLYLLSNFLKVSPANFYKLPDERPGWEEYVQDSDTVSILVQLRLMPAEQRRALNAYLRTHTGGSI